MDGLGSDDGSDPCGWCAATFGAGKVFVVEDWSPESGEEFSQGRLSILDLRNDSRSIGPPLLRA